MSDKYSFFLHGIEKSFFTFGYLFSALLSPQSFLVKLFYFNFIPSFSEWYHQSQYHVDSCVIQIALIALLTPVQCSCHNYHNITANAQCLQRPFPDRNPLPMLFLSGCWRLFPGFWVTGYQYLVSPIGSSFFTELHLGYVELQLVIIKKQNKELTWSWQRIS